MNNSEKKLIKIFTPGIKAFLFPISINDHNHHHNSTTMDQFLNHHYD